MDFKRRKLLQLLALLPVVRTLVSCGSSGDAAATPASGGNCVANGTTVSVGSNHGHSAPTITATDVSSTTPQTYIVGSGTAGHTHSLTISQANFLTLKSNQGIVITTDTDGTGHSHSISIGCA